MNSVHGEWNIGKVDLSHLTWTDTTTDTTNGPWVYTAPGGYSLSTDKASHWTRPYVLFDGITDSDTHLFQIIGNIHG